MAAKVETVLNEVSAAMPLWEVVRDCIEGQQSVKKKQTAYLPMPNPTDLGAENKGRYQNYLQRATFVNMTGRTLAGMVGTVFSKAPTVDLPVELEVLHEDIDGGAVTMDQQAKKTLTDVLSVGRGGLLTDYPNLAAPATRAQVLSGEVRPTIQFYFAENIINWRVQVIGGMRKTVLVVLKEKHVVEDDGFDTETVDQYRVLRLVNNVYSIDVYRAGKQGIVEPIAAESYVPRAGTGQPFNYIPFEFVGAQNNDPGIDEAPLLDLANINIAHYRNSADFEEIVFQVGNPTLVVTGLTSEWLEQQLGGKILLGSTIALTLPSECDAKLLQINESVIALKAMEHKERQAVAIGARLIQQQQVQRTAKEAGLEDSAQSSTLLSAAQNVNSAYHRALVSAGLFLGLKLKPEQGYKLNTDFDILGLDAAARQQLVAEFQAGLISFTEHRSILRRAGIASLTDEEAREEIDNDAATSAAALGLTGLEDPDADPNADPNAPPAAE